MTVPFLEGKSIYLRGLRPEDADGPYGDWFNDDEVCAGNSHHYFPFQKQDAASYIERSRTDRNLLAFAIVLKAKGTHIGNVSLQDINWVHRTAEFAIVVGDRSVWGKGHAKEAARLTCDHGFFSLNLHRIGCGTFEGNEAMTRLAAHLGMKEEGRRRQAVFKGGSRRDVVEYGVLRDEYARKFKGGRRRE